MAICADVLRLLCFFQHFHSAIFLFPFLVFTVTGSTISIDLFLVFFSWLHKPLDYYELYWHKKNVFKLFLPVINITYR
jgi:hypothetical protein